MDSIEINWNVRTVISHYWLNCEVKILKLNSDRYKNKYASSASSQKVCHRQGIGIELSKRLPKLLPCLLTK